MSQTRKRRNRPPECDPEKSPKKYKKTPDKEENLYGATGSDVDSGFGTTDQSLTPKIAKSSRSRETPKKRRKYDAEDIKSLDVSQLLNLGEGRSFERIGLEPSSDLDGSSDSDEDDWEEVKVEEKVVIKNPVIPKEGVNITLEVPGINSLKRKKKGFDFEAHIKRQMNQVKRELQLLMHKVHILCWIAHLKYINTVLNGETLMGVSLSLINNKNLYPPKYSDLSYLERIVKWFHSVIQLKEHQKNPEQAKELPKQLIHQFSIKEAYSKKHFVFMFIIILRSLGLKTRLVMSFQVVPIKPKNIELTSSSKSSTSQVKNHSTKGETQLKKVEGEVAIVKVENSSYFPNSSGCETVQNEHKLKKKSESSKCEKMYKSSSDKNNEKLGTKNKIDNCRKKTVKAHESLPEECDSDDDLVSKHFKSSGLKPRRIKTGRKCGSGMNVSNLSVKDSLNVHKSNTSVNLTSQGQQDCETPKLKSKLIMNMEKSKVKEKEKVGKSVKKSKSTKPKVNRTPDMKNKIIEKATRSSDTDSDFVPQSLKKKSEQNLNIKVVSSDEEEHESIKKQGMDVWAEIFLEAEEKWISVDAVRQKIHCVNELHSRATQPVVYVIACNNNSTLKDVTKRYVPHWHSDTRKRRVDEEWWNETIWPYLGPKTAQDREEDEDINQQLLDKPLPTAISEFKDHPLYALKRHLLKFEAIYPPDAPALGFVKGEPVYARECVVTLRSREVWYKEARVVRVRETPYKIVKARPKYDKMSGDFRKDLPLDLFGIWQTEEYIPPVATDGKVPRNEYGNVDLFKSCMLPKGTVHLQIPNLNKIAKKLGIDCAAAVVGFEFHSGAAHPLIDGFVVCEEFKEVILDAWNKEIDESNKKNEEKRLKRIYDNWKRLIRGLYIREKLKVKYAFGDEIETSKPTSGGKKTIKKK